MILKSAQNDVSSQVCLLVLAFVLTILTRPPRPYIHTIPILLPVTLATLRLPLSKRFLACSNT